MGKVWGSFVTPCDFLSRKITFSKPVEIFLPSISSVSSITEVRLGVQSGLLKWYLSRTRQLRSSSQLFIATIAPHNAVSRDAFYRGLIEAIELYIVLLSFSITLFCEF